MVVAIVPNQNKEKQYRAFRRENKIVSEVPYTEEDLAYYTNGRADQEQNDLTARPVISGGVENMDAYNTIILGYPKMVYAV